MLRTFQSNPRSRHRIQEHYARLLSPIWVCLHAYQASVHMTVAIDMDTDAVPAYEQTHVS